MQIRNSYVLYACVLGLMISMTALSAQATFSNASLKGGYSVLINRWTTNQNENQTAYVGVMTFDGAGNVALAFTAMSGGVEQTGNGTGTYSVNGNGTGTITFGGNPEYAIIVKSTKSGVSGGIALLRIDSNYASDAVETGTAVLQSSTAITFSAAKLKGNQTFQLDKWSATGNADGAVAIISFNGAGGLKGSATDRSSNGVQNLTGC